MNGQADGQLAGEREAEAGAAAHVLPGGEVPRAAPAPLTTGASQEDLTDEPLTPGGIFCFTIRQNWICFLYS